MKKTILAILILSVSSFLFSFEYIMNTNPSGIGSYTGVVQITNWTPNADDGYYDLAIPEGNKFYYYGKMVTHLRIFTNGVVHLFSGSSSLTSGTAGNYPIPYPGSNPNSIVAPFWDDWDLRTTGGVYYQIVQNADKNNYISVEWRGVPRYNFPSTAYSFSCAFLSSNNCFLPNTIIFAYADVDSGNAAYDNGKDATVGIENSTGTIGEQYSYNEAIVTNGMRITFTPFVPVYGTTTDHMYDPYGYEDDPEQIVFRPSNGTWYVRNTNVTTRIIQFGTKGDVAVPGDYDFDQCFDECVFRPSNSTWYCNSPNFIIPFGTTGDIPVPADYNGDYKTDIAVFRPANNTWYIHRTSDGGQWVNTWGTEGDIPMPAFVFSAGGGAYSIMTVFRPGSGYWFSLNQSTGAIWIDHYGQDGDVPLVFKCSGSYNDQFMNMVFRPENGMWFGFGIVQWGTLGDKPRSKQL